MKTLLDIQNTLSKRKQALQERFHVREIGIFGSFARGEQTRRSDVDKLVRKNNLVFATNTVKDSV